MLTLGTLKVTFAREELGCQTCLFPNVDKAYCGSSQNDGDAGLWVIA